MRAIVLDTETTGLYWTKGHRIIELACAEIRDREPTGRTWHWYFNPRRSIDYGAQEVHGITEEFLEGYPQFFEAAEDILNVFGDDKLIMHNAPFDTGFLNAEFKRLPLYPLITEDRVIDTLAIARQKYPGGKNGLDGLCRRFKIDLSQRTKHSAELDTQLLMKVYFHLEIPEQICFDLSREPTIEPCGSFVRLRPLEPRLTESELQAHAILIAGLGKESGNEAIWYRYMRE